MTNRRLVPHLYFKETCEAALRFYEACGLGRIRALTYHDGSDSRVLHAELEGPGLLLFGGDGTDSEPMKGCALLMELEDAARARELFAALSNGGRVTVPYGRKPWGDYGNFTDRFGVQWAILVRPPG